ncbi:MAG: urease accessory protein UreD [Marinifilaceae bacterium]
MNDFTQCKEAMPYMTKTRAMYGGAPGKRGKVDLVFELDKTGKSIMRHWDRRFPQIIQKELYFDEGMPELPCVYILSAGGPNVDGDRYENFFTVKKDACAYISTGAATKIAEMKLNFSGLTQQFTLEDGAYLEYLPEPTIPCRNSRYVTDTTITIADTATLFYSEIYNGGRKYYKGGELFVYDLLSICTRAFRPDGTPLFREKLVATPKDMSVRNIGTMHNYDVFANVLVLTTPDAIAEIYEKTAALLNKTENLAIGITHLPNNCGLLMKVLGQETPPVRKAVRDFCATVRMAVKQKPLPREFPWR